MSSPAPSDSRRTAAFFDVDGTLTATNIAHYYVYFRRRLMSPAAAAVWYPAFLLKCVYYLALDRKDRSRLNIVFYRGYAGLPAARVKDMASDCHREVVSPRLFAEAASRVMEHRRAQEPIVLVTGSLDFTVRPLADEIGADGLLASTLVECDGRFTGVLVGAPVGGEEKARRMRDFARERGIDLAGSHAYGDSIADLPMLEAVGHPHAVNPDGALERAATKRGWPVHRWKTTSRDGSGI